MSGNVYNAKVEKRQLSIFDGLAEKLGYANNIVSMKAKRPFNFKGRKSDMIAKVVIKYLTDKDSKVCDPFMGSGSFPIASAILGRKTLGIELDNYTFSVVKTLLQKADIKQIKEMFQIIKEEIFNEIMSLYETSCCGERNFIKILYYDPETSEYFNPRGHREIKNNHNIKLYYKCPTCGNISKEFDEIDKTKITFTNTLNTSKFPKHTLIENSRINITASSGANIYDVNFTNRNKYALLKIQEAINKFAPSIERDVLEHALVSSLTLARIAQYGSGSEYIYQVMRFQAQEMNVWYLFEDKVTNFLEYKTSYTKSIQCNTIDDSQSMLTLREGDYISILNQEKYKEYFDLLYTDPPYTDQVPYIERSQLYRDWLFEFYDRNQFKLTKQILNAEMVVSNAPARSSTKDIDNYYNDIDRMFKTFNYCTKVNGVVALTLNLGKDKYFRTFSELINKAKKNGFEYIYRIDLTKNDPSLRKQAAFSNTLSKEMLVFFMKLSHNKAYWYIDDKNIEHEIAKLVYKLIIDNSGVTLSKAVIEVNKKILNTDINGDDQNNNRIVELLREQFFVDDRTSMVYTNPDKLYFSIEDDTTLFNKLYDIVPILINKLLETKEAFCLDDLYFDISSKICNGDPVLLNKILCDPSREHHIFSLLDNYCDINDKKLYVKKQVCCKSNEDAIDIAVLDGTEFEEVLKRLLEAEGFIDVIRIGGAGDRGIDLRAKKRVNSILEGYIFQSKRWIANVGGEPIQRLHSMMMQYPTEIQHAVCITTSDYTEYGKREAESTKVEIINGEKLMYKLNAAFPGEYSHSLLNFKI